MFSSSVTSRMQRDSLHVYQQDVDLTSELTACCGLTRKGKLLNTHTRRGRGRGLMPITASRQRGLCVC